MCIVNISGIYQWQHHKSTPKVTFVCFKDDFSFFQDNVYCKHFQHMYISDNSINLLREWLIPALKVIYVCFKSDLHLLQGWLVSVSKVTCVCFKDDLLSTPRMTLIFFEVMYTLNIFSMYLKCTNNNIMMNLL